MTTATPGYRTMTRGSAVLGASVSTVAVGAVLVAVAALVSGAAAAAGAGTGALTVFLFFLLGAATVGSVVRVAPGLSLLVALLTYTLQVVLLALVFRGLSRSGALVAGIDTGWLGWSVIGCTLVWTTAPVLQTLRVRQPVYDLPPDEGRSEEVEAR
jgi:ATP synthase protein I